MSASRLAWIGLLAMGLAAAFGVGTAMLGDAAVSHAALDPLEWARYPEHRVLPVAEGLRLDGYERDLAYFLTADDPITVADTYEARLGALGFETTRRVSGGEEIVLARAGAERRTVVATPRGRVTAVLVSRRVSTREGYPVEPLVEDCEPLHHSAAHDRGHERSVWLVRCSTDVSAVLEPLSERFGAPLEHVVEAGRGMASFRAGEAEAQLLYAVREDETGVETLATVRVEETR